MPETFKVKDICTNNSTFVSWALIHLISQKTAEFLPNELRNKDLTVELKINGIEVSFTDMCARLAEMRGEDIKRHALELLRDKLGNTMDALYRIEREVMSTAKTELGIDWED